MQRRNFLKLTLAGSASLLTSKLAFGAQDSLQTNHELMIDLEKRLGFRVIQLEQKPTGMFHAVLDNGDHPFALYSNDTKEWHSHLVAKHSDNFVAIPA